MSELLPPFSVEAEQAVLGAMLIDPDAFFKVDVTLNAADFYVERHRWLYEAYADMVGGRRAIDFVTLCDELERRGQLNELGGAAYITELIGATPTSLNVVDYAVIVERLAVQRRLVLVGADIVQIGRKGEEEDPAAMIQAAQSKLIDATLRKGDGAITTAKDVADLYYEHVDDRRKRGKEIIGLPTGSLTLDRMLYGLLPTRFYTLAGRPGMGKCLGKGTRVVMLDGSLCAVEDIRAGDILMGPDSRGRVVLSTCSGREEMYWIQQKHGTDYRVNGSHILSLKRSKNEGPWQHGEVRNFSVADILSKGSGFFGRWKGYKVAIELEERSVALSPYFLGLWLGDGKSDDGRIYSAEPEVAQFLEEYARGLQQYVVVSNEKGTCNAYAITGGRSQRARDASITANLRRMGLLGNKHIPEVYLRNAKHVRLELLAGLIDSDGHYPKNQSGPYEITMNNQHLVEQINWLCHSLGYRTSLDTRTVACQTGAKQEVYRVRFNGNVDEIPVRVVRKKAKPWAGNCDWVMTGISIEPDGVGDYYGFTLSGDGLFLLEDMTVTHNSALALAIALNVANAGKHVDDRRKRGKEIIGLPTGSLTLDRMLYGLLPTRFYTLAGRPGMGKSALALAIALNVANAGKHVAVFSFEMGGEQLFNRWVAMTTGIDSRCLFMGQLRDDEWPKWVDAVGKLSGTHIYIDDGTAMLGSVVSKARMMYMRYGLDLLIVDYLQLMSDAGGGRRNENREQEVARISRGMKALAMELKIPVLAVCQLNRGPEMRKDKHPMLSDLRESGTLEQDSDVVMALYRDDYYNEDSEEPGIVHLDVLKWRDGPIGRVFLKYIKETNTFYEVDLFRKPLDGFSLEDGEEVLL